MGQQYIEFKASVLIWCALRTDDQELQHITAILMNETVSAINSNLNNNIDLQHKMKR
jgi:hypothetical protein